MVDTPQTCLSTTLGLLAPLHGLAARCADILAIFKALTAASLAHYPSANARRFSTFTSDGLPFELSLSLSQQAQGGLRYGTEAGDLKAPFPERLAHSHALTLQLLARIGAATWQDVHQRLFDLIFPPYIRALRGDRFGLWQGMVHRPGRADTLKVYYNLSAWGPEVAAVLGKIFETLRFDLDARQLRQLTQHLPGNAQMIFLGMDYSADGQLCAKFYHRCGAAVPLAAITDLLVANGMEAQRPTAQLFFRKLAQTQGQLPPRALLIHVGLSAPAQDPVLGLYVPLHRFFYGDQGAHSHLLHLLAALAIDSSLYTQTLQHLTRHSLSADIFHHHTLVGLGLSRQTFKVNLYLRPWLERPDA